MTSGEVSVHEYCQIVNIRGLETKVPHQSFGSRKVPDQSLELFDSGFSGRREEPTQFFGGKGYLWSIHCKIIGSGRKSSEESDFGRTQDLTFRLEL